MIKKISLYSMVCNDFVIVGNLFSYGMQLCIFVEHGILNDSKNVFIIIWDGKNNYSCDII